MKRLLVLLGIALACTQAAAHEVHSTIAADSATVVTLTYADGRPFSFEAFEVFEVLEEFAGGTATPLAVGRTDARGRAVFMAPPAGGELRLRAFSADGHGVDLRLTPPAAAGAKSPPPAATNAGDERWSRILFGLGLLLGAFGLIQLFQKKRESAQ